MEIKRPRRLKALQRRPRDVAVLVPREPDLVVQLHGLELHRKAAQRLVAYGVSMRFPPLPRPKTAPIASKNLQKTMKNHENPMENTRKPCKTVGNP